MNEMQLLTWVRGTGLNIAITLFLLGLLWRLIEIYSLGRKKDLAPARAAAGASGFHTIFRRSVPPPGMLKRSPVSYIGGYILHVGLAIIVFFFAPHIKLVEGLIGISWPALPSQVIDGVTVLPGFEASAAGGSLLALGIAAKPPATKDPAARNSKRLSNAWSICCGAEAANAARSPRASNI